MRTSFNAYLIARVEEGGSLKLLKALTALRASTSTDLESGEVRAHIKGGLDSLENLIPALRGLSSLTKYCIVKPYLIIKTGRSEFRKVVKSLRDFCSASVSMPGGVFRCVKGFTNATIFLEGRHSSGVMKAYVVRGSHPQPQEFPDKIRLFIPCSELREEIITQYLNNLLSCLKEVLR